MKTKNESTVIAEAIHKWLNTYLPSLKANSGNTIRAYHMAMSLYVKYLEREKEMTMTKLSASCFSAKNIEEWLLWLKENRKCSNKTCNHRLASIRCFLKYLVKSDIRFMNVYADAMNVEQMKVSKERVEGISKEGIKAILSVPVLTTPIGRRDLVIMALLYGTAARIGEILSLRMEDIHTETKKPYVSLLGKGNKRRIAYLLPRLVTILKTYSKEYHKAKSETDTLLFYSTYRGEKGMLTQEAIGKRLKKYAAKAHEICNDVPLDLHSHGFRHARAGHWLEDGLNIVIIKELLGHENLNTTMIYVGITTEQESKALAVLEDEEEKGLPKKWKKNRPDNLASKLGLDEIKIK
jgi:site-specific recombinase XerD